MNAKDLSFVKKPAVANLHGDVDVISKGQCNVSRKGNLMVVCNKITDGYSLNARSFFGKKPKKMLEIEAEDIITAVESTLLTDADASKYRTLFNELIEEHKATIHLGLNDLDGAHDITDAASALQNIKRRLYLLNIFFPVTESATA
jgi:hypothetical protein